MCKRFLVVGVLVTAIASVAAQGPGGWKVRIDRSRNAEDPDNTPSLKFDKTAKGFHVIGGPAGTFWNPTQSAMGAFTLKATFVLVRPSNHVNYYGLVFGGSDLEGAAQTYTYFVVAQNGTYLIRHRTGESVQDVQTRMTHASVKQPDSNGSSTNALEVRVSGNTISYVVNGTVVHSTPRTGGVKTDGLVGVRINHVLDVQVEGFELQKLG
jgi:protein-disulfide isomerase